MNHSTRQIGKTHPVTLKLAKSGLTWKQAHIAVNAVFDSIKEALKRHEQVDLGFGVLEVVEQPVRRHRRWRFGQPQEVFRNRYRVNFRPRELE